MKGIYLAGGYPDRETFKKSFKIVAESGFDFIEVGLPYNDPIADGPVISSAILETLEKGIKVSDVIDDIISLSDVKIDRYIMTYANIVHSFGEKNFSDKFGGMLKGVIVPDVPNRMADFLYKRGLSVPVVPFATLETRDRDFDLINSSAAEFVYFIGIRGITGAASDLSSDEIKEKIARIRKMTQKKIVIGFGIKSKADADAAMKLGDGFVIGTEAVRRQGNPEELKRYLKEIIR